MTTFETRHIRLAAGGGYPPHAHEHDHTLAVARGRLAIVYDGRRFEYEEGEIAVMKAGVRHAVFALTDVEIERFGPTDLPERKA